MGAIQRAAVFNGTAPGANTGILNRAAPNGIGSTVTPGAGVTRARLTIALTTSSVVNVVATDATTTHKWGVAGSTALNAADLYEFEFDVDADLAYDVEVETDSVIEVLLWSDLVDAGAAGAGPQGASGGLALPAGESHIGQVGGEGTRVSVTPTVTAGAYSASDVIGGELEFANAARVSAGGGYITHLLLVDDAGQDFAGNLWLFSQGFAVTLADNATWAPAEAELHNLVAIIPISASDWQAAGTPSAAQVKDLALRFDCAATSLFGYLVTSGTPTLAATDDITVILGLSQD